MTDEPCPFCGECPDDPVGCDATTEESDGLVLFCTRAVGHEGDHVACAGNEHEIARWRQGKDVKQ